MGTRLKPLTDRMPKALVPVGGVPMLARIIEVLKSQGYDSIVVNVHHFGWMIKDYLESHDFGLKIEISDESDSLLDTGGALVKGYPLLFGDGTEYVTVHNVDILSNADLGMLAEGMDASETDLRLLVSDRDSTRKLIFDREMNLRGWHNLATGDYRPEGASQISGTEEFAFSGIYVVGKRAVEEMSRLFGEKKFSVMDYFLDERRKSSIKGIVQEGLRLIDIGKPATLSQASELLNGRNSTAD